MRRKEEPYKISHTADRHIYMGKKIFNETRIEWEFKFTDPVTRILKLMVIWVTVPNVFSCGKVSLTQSHWDRCGFCNLKCLLGCLTPIENTSIWIAVTCFIPNLLFSLATLVDARFTCFLAQMLLQYGSLTLFKF